MNKQRRKAISEIIEQMEDLALRLEELQSDEQEAFDALPDSFRDGEKGDNMQSNISDIEETANEIRYGIDRLQEAVDR